jgi:uncharacterized repeat protein (TIGR03803 family)
MKPRLRFVVTLAALCALLTIYSQAQNFQVIYSFPGGTAGGNPDAGLTMDRGGNFYGTTGFGGSGGCDYECGTVFKLSNRGHGWVLNVLYSFEPNINSFPQSRAIIGPNGSLYSTTFFGGAIGYGTVFNLQPPAHATASVLTPWTNTILHSFAGGSDGSNPISAVLIFDPAGNIYGTTPTGGAHDNGIVFELSPSNGGWTEKILYDFPGGASGINPTAGVILDSAGNLYGVTIQGGQDNCGTVYELSPNGDSWAETTLHTFVGGPGGCFPAGGLTFDGHGNLIGTTAGGGGLSGSTVFMLSPSGGSWNFSVLYSLGNFDGPEAEMTFDSAGNLYGTTTGGGAYRYGNVFRLSPSSGGWSYTSLYDFTNGSDGGNPHSNVLIDANGNLFGTTNGGAINGTGCPGGCGTVWEITP